MAAPRDEIRGWLAIRWDGSLTVISQQDLHTVAWLHGENRTSPFLSRQMQQPSPRSRMSPIPGVLADNGPSRDKDSPDVASAEVATSTAAPAVHTRLSTSDPKLGMQVTGPVVSTSPSATLGGDGCFQSAATLLTTDAPSIRQLCVDQGVHHRAFETDAKNAGRVCSMWPGT